MEKEILEYLILIIVIAILIIANCFYIANDQSKKMKYYKKTISFDTNWEKYNDMVEEQKKIIRKKKFQLLGLSILVFFKEVFTWK